MSDSASFDDLFDLIVEDLFVPEDRPLVESLLNHGQDLGGLPSGILSLDKLVDLRRRLLACLRHQDWWRCNQDFFSRVSSSVAGDFI